MPYRAVICDLGGVVVRVDSDRVRQNWAALSDLPDAASLTPYPDATHEAFERGDVTEAEYFDRVHCSHELRARKPEPAAFEQALAAHALDGGEAVFIDDVPDYVDAATALGMHGILFETAPALARDLDRLSWTTAEGSSSKPRR